MLPSLRLRRCREQPLLLLVARDALVLVEGVARQILGPRGDYRLVGGPPSQTRRSRAEGIEGGRPGGGVVANRGGYLGGRALLGELEGGAGYGESGRTQSEALPRVGSPDLWRRAGHHWNFDSDTGRHREHDRAKVNRLLKEAKDG